MDTNLVLKYLKSKPTILDEFIKLGGMTKQPSVATISQNVAALRNAQRLSQAALAKKAGLSQKVVSNLENAKELGIYPTIHTLTLVAEALNVSLFALMLPMDAEQLRAIQGDQDFDRSFARLLDTYPALPPLGRQTVDRIIELESLQFARPPPHHRILPRPARPNSPDTY